MESRKRLGQKKLEYILRSSEYNEILNEAVKSITERAGTSQNEATTVSTIELELYSIVREVLGLKFFPEKENKVDTVIHKAKGRIDSKIGYLIIEYKHYSKLNTENQIQSATDQLLGYLEGLYVEYPTDYLGVITDGISIKFIRFESGQSIVESIKPLMRSDLDRIIKAILSLDRVALTSKNLVKDFALSGSISNSLSKVLYQSLLSSTCLKTEALFNEWKELFKLSHDDKSLQTSILQRRKSLEEALQTSFSGNINKEYMALFSLQTTYAIIVKIIAFKVISNIYFSKPMVNFDATGKTDNDTLKVKLQALEDGEVFRDVGLMNLLEGDFFSWYSSEQQWNDIIANSIRPIFQALSKYEDISLFKDGINVQDLFKELYQEIMPEKVRSNLGEFYTPPWLADKVIDDALSYQESEHWTALDPCAGSGTFLTRLIAKVLEGKKQETAREKSDTLREIINRVVGIDLNPLAVLTARINYFINISHLINEGDHFEIPVYLGDAAYVPEIVNVDGIECVRYSLNTLKGNIDISIPVSALKDRNKFATVMDSIEFDIQLLDKDAVVNKLSSLIDESEKTVLIIDNIIKLADKLLDLEQSNWNGIWSRIIKNYLITSSIGKFELIVGNPPWVDWKNLPSVYRERIKETVCIDNSLFSGANRTGGINLNICALISNVSADKWLKKDGVLAFLMPKSLIHQPSYEGFRKFKISDGDRLYLQEVTDWTKSGHPFHPVQEKFLTFIYSRDNIDYFQGIPVTRYLLRKGKNLKTALHISDFKNLKEWFIVENLLAAQISMKSTTLAYGIDSDEIKMFQRISGDNEYIGREGIEFYPQELYLLKEVDHLSPVNDCVWTTNFQGKKSKHKVPSRIIPIEKKYLHPLVKGSEIKKFHWSGPNYIVPFPYKKMEKIPLPLKELSKDAPKLAKYFYSNKEIILSQTDYSGKIINNSSAEFYALARVGVYSYADYSVAYRDNTKWQAAVVGPQTMSWGDVVNPLFQNHAVTISQRPDNTFISEDEAYYICAIFNSPVVYNFLMNSSDSRSFKIRVPIKLPLYDPNNSNHKELVILSKEAHLKYDNAKEIERIEQEINTIYLNLCE